jgi:hypothetical protein
MVTKSISTSRRFAALAAEAGALGEFAQTLFLLLIVHSDDFGRLEGDPWTVRLVAVPTSPRTEQEVATALAAMAEVGLIRWYDVDGRRFVEIVGFEDHQSGLHKRTRSRFPEPPGDSGKLPEIPSERNGTERKGTEGREQAALAAGPRPSDLLDLWRAVCVPAGFATVRVFDDELRRKASSRLREEPDLTVWREVFTRIAASPFCRGDAGSNGRKAWRADFRWIVANESNRAKVLEGRYDGGGAPGAEAYTPC